MSTQTAHITLPPGVKVAPGIETSGLNAQGQVIQGIKFGLTLKDGTITTVFVPYTLLDAGNWSAVDQLIRNRVNSIEAITG